MKAKSIKGKSTEEIQRALTESKKDRFTPTLAIVFITKIENAKAIQSILDAAGIAIFGASTSEKFTEEGIDPDGIVVLLLDINPNHFRIVLKEYNESSPYEAARQVGTMGINTFKNPGFIISAIDFRISGEELINGLVNIAGQDVTVMGGMAGNPANFSGVLFTNDASSSTGGVMALIIDQDKIEISGLAVSGWKPAGTAKKITKGEGSWIYTIDDEPAMNVIQKFLGNEIVINTDAESLVPMDAGYPLQFQRVSGTPIMKPVLLWNKADQSVMVGGHIKEGDHFRFSLPPDFDVIDTVIESTRVIKEKEMPEADALIVFSCVGRLGTLGPLISVEIEGLAATWNKPMIGFFSLGEFGKLDESQCEFHGTTVSWVALKEKYPSTSSGWQNNIHESKIN